jgi:glutamate dehydrogenase
MTTRRTTAPPPAELGPWLERLGADEPPAQRALLQTFARLLLERASPEYLREHAPDLADEVAAAFDLLDRTPPRAVGVRVRLDPRRAHRAIVNSVMPDRPFIVDTVREHLVAEGFEIDALLHPVLAVERDRAGRVVTVRGRTAAGPKVSVVHCRVRDHLDAARATALEAGLRERLEDVLLVTDDFELMVARVDAVADELRRLAERRPDEREELLETVEFLRWLRDRGFLFLGYRAYALVSLPDGRAALAIEPNSGLGILRREDRSAFRTPRPLDELPDDVRERFLHGPVLFITKSNAESQVRRRARMDYVGVKRLDAEGRPIGEHRFLGLFTRKAYGQPAGDIPVLRRKLEQILARTGAERRSHDYEAIVAIFHSLPKEELFVSTVEDLEDDIARIIETEGTGEVRLRVRRDPWGRGVQVLVLIPPRLFSEAAHRQIREEMVRTFGGTVLYDHAVLPEGQISRIHLYLSAPRDRIDAVHVDELEERIARLVKGWTDRLAELLEERNPPEVAHALADRYEGAFSPEYMATVDPETALADIASLEAVRTTGELQVSLRPLPGEAGEDASQLRIFARHGELILADLIPTLDNLGIRVLEADAVDVGRGTEKVATVHTLVVQGPDRRALDAARVEPLLAAALRAIRAGLIQDYPLNRLVVSALLPWEAVQVLMAYAGYAFQILAVSSRKAIVDALTGYPTSARLLYEYFCAKFDPAYPGDRADALARLEREFANSLGAVEGIADDRTLRRLFNLVQATTRTNAFQSRMRGRPLPVLALKFDGAAIEALPRPRTLVDLYVYSAAFEGIHLRRGRVARGGIRWSDRLDDFRTETLDLVKTQHVKNAVIVPVGAKGAFVLRHPPADRARWGGAGLEAYRQFIRACLDVTDNVQDGQVVHPPETVVWDGDDPYFVVAPDKGTATFSDEANAIAAEYGFWLGDAFASGGSHGYDHKKLGITAKGVWECVRRHFRELGVDADRDPITVVGIGDMSGDVFGNGMLLSRTLKLVAAFDHRNIFLDPDPDPEISYAERRRLFEMPGSSWEDYDRSRLSAGGGIYKRGAKEIPLSPEARARLGIADPVVNGETLIRAILRAPVDLLWNGGIGTYVKASWETHAEVGDPANDAVRVDASEVRARVVGEGGNLGFTQAARVEYALHGGRCNTDAIDNSGGVDCSDHEVNLKILLDAAVRTGRLDREERNRLLAAVADEVVADVLADNHSQSRALSLDALRAQRHPADFRDLMAHLQRRGQLDRAVDRLPDAEELQERAQAGQGLTRPELAILLAYAKMDLKREILASALPDDPALLALLHAYVPAGLRDRVPRDALEAHPLRRQIIATVLANRLVDLMGATFAFRIARDTGVPASAVARAWYAAAEIAELDAWLRRLRALERDVPAELEYRWLLDVAASLERATRWTIDNCSETAHLRAIVESHREPVARLRTALPHLLPDGLRTPEPGGPHPELAEAVASLRVLDELLDVTRIARELELDIVEVARAYYRIGSSLDIPWLAAQLDAGADDDPWSRRARQLLLRDLRHAHRRWVAAGLDRAREGAGIHASLQEFERERGADLAHLRNLAAELRQSDRPTLGALLVLVREIAARAAPPA